MQSLPNVDGLYLDSDEWSKPWTRGAPILHIELRRWADLMLIAPLSANGLTSLSLGLSNNLLYSVARAWDTTGLIDKPRRGIGKNKIIVAPAMNTAMWNQPVTRRHLDVLEEDWNVKNGGWVSCARLAPRSACVSEPLTLVSIGRGLEADRERSRLRGHGRRRDDGVGGDRQESVATCGTTMAGRQC